MAAHLLILTRNFGGEKPSNVSYVLAMLRSLSYMVSATKEFFDVIPAKAGVQSFYILVPRLRGDDVVNYTSNKRVRRRPAFPFNPITEKFFLFRGVSYSGFKIITGILQSLIK